MRYYIFFQWLKVQIVKNYLKVIYIEIIFFSSIECLIIVLELCVVIVKYIVIEWNFFELVYKCLRYCLIKGVVLES